MVEHNQSQYYGNQYKFNGKELDAATGMYYYGARYYDPRLSIFISVDPLAEETMTPYQYVSNNPIMRIDPTGMNDHDYKVNKEGDITLIRRTKDNFDRLFNEDGSESVTVGKSFLNNSKSSPDGQAMIYPLSHNEVKNGNGEKVFDFFKNNTIYEYQLHEFKDKKSGAQSGYIGSSFEHGFVNGVGSEFRSRMDANMNLINTKDIHSHDGGGAFSESARPSGFSPNLTRYENSNGKKIWFGDVKVYIQNQIDYPGRTPKFYEIRLNKDRSNQVKILFNNEKVIRTHCGIPY